ncbi:4-hydroxy-tetrahydrodipicolinate synthase [Candidatus Allofournierella merdipullorum]|uniref:4-hydroxy-tetrahydrodipicolinate synthase n=1 Tax=Candidatus Allofournierella merdipullorum TaxID=2838595 RepID=UPI003AB77E66
MKTPIFTGAAVAIITPMLPDGSVDYKGLADLVEFQIKGGTDAIVICGTTGESATLKDDEHLECIRVAVETAAGRVPVIAGTGSNYTEHAVEMSKEAKARGADALLLVTPYYNKTTQRGLVASFNTIVDAAGLPAILYNVPSRTGVNIESATAKELAKNPLICGIKEASGNISQIAMTAALCGDELPLYSGNDDQVVPILALGGKGVISVVSNVAPEPMHRMCQLWFEGKVEESRDLQLQLMGLCKAMFCEVNPIPVKAALGMMGLPAGPCRLPLVPLSDDHAEQVRRELQNAGLL